MDELYRPFKKLDTSSRFVKTPVERIINDMDKAGVDKACLMASDHRRPYPYDSLPSYTPNEYVAKIVQEYPDRFVGTASVDPIRDPYGARQELEKCVKEWDMRAVKLYPTYDHYYPTDELVMPIYEKAIELDIPVHIHMGWTPCVNAPMKYQQPYLLDEVGIKYPKLKVIVAHLGYPWVDECICLIAKHQNFHADLALWGALPPETVLNAMHKFDNLCGLDRLLYGSENPWITSFVKTMKNINKIAQKRDLPKINDEDMNKIMGENAIKLFKMKRTG
jgi:predicted TIM-barrel fold metal-dependent hydrolase